MKENNVFLKVGVAAAALLITVGVVYALYAFKPTTKKRKPTTVVPIVEAIDVSPGSEEVIIEASGTVVPAREAIITTEVEGKIIRQNRNLVPGGVVAKGAELVVIDPEDYRLQAAERKSALAEAESKLELEKGQQVIAKKEWQIFEKDQADKGADNSLALREPQLKSAEAAVEAARSRLAIAEYALKKTTILAPFGGVVIDEAVEVGQFAGRQTKIATLAGTDHFWVQAAIPPAYLGRISFPGKGRKPSRVKVILESPGGEEVLRIGVVEKLLADLDPKGRMARILVRIDDPLNLAGKRGRGRILLGSFVRLGIEAGRVDNVYTIPREAVAEGDRLLIMKEDGTIDIRNVEVKWRRKDDLLLAAEIAKGERLIISRLQNALPGMKVRTGEGKKVGDIRDSTKMGEEGKKQGQ